jgi:hypothetical protein
VAGIEIQSEKSNSSVRNQLGHHQVSLRIEEKERNAQQTNQSADGTQSNFGERVQNGRFFAFLTFFFSSPLKSKPTKLQNINNKSCSCEYALGIRGNYSTTAFPEYSQYNSLTGFAGCSAGFERHKAEQVGERKKLNEKKKKYKSSGLLNLTTNITTATTFH